MSAHSTFEIREEFLNFFKHKEHLVLPSAPLVPSNDPTLMFTNAGMVPFKDIFVGRKAAPAPRAASVQKCIRISGKHNDLENVGRTSRHHTFFEMLGNFSFGDYFKESACTFAWELLTCGLRLDPDRLWVTVFEGDDSAPRDEEAERIWRDVVKVPAERIVRCGAKDNFWAMGDTGPCGPCSEVHFDRGDKFGPAVMENAERFFEVWNLVFMQYNVTTVGGPLLPLPRPCIDTGAGLERIASVLQGVDSNYDTDVFRPLIHAAAKIAGKKYGADEKDDVSMRVIADHARMASFLIAEGIFPEKTGREYVLRRVMRRAIRHGHRLGIRDLFLHEIAASVIEEMSGAYPELRDHSALIARVCSQEEERFRATLDRGLDLLRVNTSWETGEDGRRMLPGELAFDLTATYGFPRDLIKVIGEEDGFVIDASGYAEAERKHKLVSGAGKIGDKALDPIYQSIKDTLGATEFKGYETLECAAEVKAIIVDGELVDVLQENNSAEVIFDKTPFYGESGGQVGDSGDIETAHAGIARVTSTARPIPELFVHRVEVGTSGSLRKGETYTLRVNSDRRAAIRRHHTATHLLHRALREVLGPHATQKGSWVGPDRLRFDFSHFEALTPDQVDEIEQIVATRVVDNRRVVTETLSYDEARSHGAMALFGETYGDAVRMVSVGKESVELCGGTHAERSGDIGAFFIVDETSIAAGVRRIEAVAGPVAQQWAADRRRALARAAALLKVSAGGLDARLAQILAREKELTKEIEQLKRRLVSGGTSRTDPLQNAREIEGVKVVSTRLEIGDPATLRDTADRLRQQLGSGVICLAGDNGGKAAIVVAVTKDLAKTLHAGNLIKEVVSEVGGRGGGRADLAQAGGPDVAGLDAAVERIYKAVARAAKP